MPNHDALDLKESRSQLCLIMLGFSFRIHGDMRLRQSDSECRCCGKLMSCREIKTPSQIVFVDNPCKSSFGLSLRYFPVERRGNGMRQLSLMMLVQHTIFSLVGAVARRGYQENERAGGGHEASQLYELEDGAHAREQHAHAAITLVRKMARARLVDSKERAFSTTRQTYS